MNIFEFIISMIIFMVGALAIITFGVPILIFILAMIIIFAIKEILF